MRGKHRVALELEVEEDPEETPEDWDLSHLSRALQRGTARPVRTIRGLVLDPEHDRLSDTLEAIASDLDEAVQLQWLATSKPWPWIVPALLPRPSLELLVQLEQHVCATRRLAQRLFLEGL